MTYRICPLALERQDRDSFSCGVAALDRYFRETVSQDIRRRVATCFVALDEHGRLAGFYTLAATSVLLTDLPAAVAKKLPRYPLVPAVRMGRLAVQTEHHGRGLGAALLADALERSLGLEVGAFALVVDSKDEHASAFYQHHGFLSLPGQPLSLFLPLATAKAALR